MSIQKIEYLPAVAVIIPAYKHSSIMSEAIESALSQKASFQIHIVIVNDGCPYKTTEDVSLDYAISYPESITYLRKTNGGLSSARNFGIKYALNKFRSVTAVYLLDADNRLEEYAISNAMDLLEKNTDSDWIYPNIDMFGMPWSGDYSGEYSLLAHTSTNICEAGSLISSNVFESGIYFDETMKLGFEDWDFFLTAAKNNFRGKNLPEFGFKYRKRPESMLADSHRDENEIKGAMLRKHKSLFLPKKLIELEQKEFPRYAIYIVDRNEFIFTTDPEATPTETLTTKEFYKRFWSSMCSGGKYTCPFFIFVTYSDTIQLLSHMKVTYWVFWKLEESLSRSHMAALSIKTTTVDRYLFDEIPNVNELAAGASILVMAPSTFVEVMKDPSNLWIDSIISNKCEPSINQITLQLPLNFTNHFYQANDLAPYDFLALVHALKTSAFRNALGFNWNWREDGIPERSRAFQIIRKQFGGMPVLPIVSNAKKINVGFLLPLVEFGGVEKVALNIARQLKKRGYAPHLIVSEFNEAAFSHEWREVFESIIFLDDKYQTSWSDKKSYFGTDISPWASGGNHYRALGLLYWLDVLVNCHGNAAHSLMGNLKRLGVKTVASLHLSDLTRWGRPVGHTYLSLAYEHSYDLVTTCSFQLADWCSGIGMPENKIVPIQNAPSFLIEDEDIDHSIKLRKSRSGKGDIFALVIGRLDRQKGLGRLVDFKTKAKMRNLPIHWRIIGKSIIHDGMDAVQTEISNLVEPPIFLSEELIEAYSSADVLLVLSEYEGLPLTVLEAMKLGVVVIATNVGAISEIIQHGYNGFLVSKENAVEECMPIFEQAVKNKLFFQRISENSVETMKNINWENSCREFMMKVDSLIK